jgi:hypothetical protein
MSRDTSKFSMKLTAAIAVVALAAPAAALSRTHVSSQDLRSPDTVDYAIQAQKADAAQYRRQLEAQRETPGYVDLRSPDAKDAENAGQRASAPSFEPARTVESRGFDWGDAGIGAGALLGLVLIALSVMFTVVHRRNHTPAL